MKAVVVIAFYVWLALTVAIVLGRLARWAATRQAVKRRRKARLEAQAQAQPAESQPVSVGGPPTDTPSSRPPIISPRLAPQPPEPEDDAPKPEETVAEAAERRAAERRSGDRRVGDRRRTERRAPEPEPEVEVEVEVEAEPMVEPAPVPEQPQPVRLTIAHLLAGIAIPVDLTPIVADGAVASDQFTSLICRERPAHEVGSGIADELERLGYSLTPIGEATLLASRVDPSSGSAEELTVEIDASPASPDSNGRVRFPTAAPTDVVVDFWVGRGSRPN